MKNKEQTVSLIGVIMLAVILPGILKVSNSAVRYFVGAEGRLASLTIETDRPLGPLPQPWRGLAQGGDELKTFFDDSEDQLTILKPRYIRIDHIYDQFNVVSRTKEEIILNWSELDTLIDKFTAIGAKPFFSLSYMPPALSSGNDTDEPRSWEEWSWLVQKTVEHFSGDRKIAGVYYEVWNEPDLYGEWTISGKKDYRTLYLYSSRGAEAAKNVQEFKLGGPGTTGLYKNWMDGFFPFVQQNKLRLDFFSWHRYDLDVNKYSKDMLSVDQWLENQPYFSQVEKVVTEMGPVSEAGKENDSMVGAAHIVATARELMYRSVMGMNFAIKGKWGILGKPRGEALRMLAELNGQRLAITGEGSWVRAIGAQDAGGYKVILVNYDPKGVHSEIVPVTFINLKENSFTIKRDILGGTSVEQKIATTESILQQSIPMAPNSVVMLTLTSL